MSLLAHIPRLCRPRLIARGVATKAERSAFPFIPMNALEPKPRKHGLTEIRGPYYSMMGPRYLQDIFETFGEYVDGVKYAGGSFTLQDKDSLKKMVEIAHDNGAYISTGGFIERLLSSGLGDRELLDKYLRTIKELGIDVCEISTGFISVPTRDWANLVELVASHGIKPKPELGVAFGAGGGESEQLSAPTRDPQWVVSRGRALLDAGADMLMIESEGITENVKEWRTDIISKISDGLPQEKVMYEAADPAVFSYYIQNFGADVNVFVDHSQVVQLAALRRGIWGTTSTFGRIVTFPNSIKK